MKRLLAILFSFLLVSPVSTWGAISATMQWEVRTTGNDTFGGGFDTATAGTDRSQSDTAFVVIDNVAITATVAASTITFTAGYTATAADVGNVVNLISSTGGTPPTFGRYQIGSQTPTTWVLDRTTGAVGATLTSAKMGGGLLTVALGLASIAASSSSGFNTVWVKSGTYTITTGLAAPNKTGALIGYQTTHNDMGTKPLITTATNSTVLITNSVNLGFMFGNLSLSNTAGIRAVGISVGSGPVVVSNVICDGFTNGINPNSSFSVLSMSSLEVKNSTGAGILQTVAAGNANPISLVGSYIHDNTGAGFSNAGGSGTALFVSNSIIALNGGPGIVLGSNTDVVTVKTSDFVSNTGPGISATGSSPNVFAFNSIFYANTTYGISITSPGALATFDFGLTNAYGANGTAPRNGFPVETGAITLTANPFTSATNFALNSTAGGGALLKGTGYPGAFIGGTTTSHPDVGAVQSGAPAVQVGYPLVGWLKK